MKLPDIRARCEAAVPRLSLSEIKALCEKLDTMTHAASLNDGPWDEDLVCDVADYTPALVAWAERARGHLEELESEIALDTGQCRRYDTIRALLKELEAEVKKWEYVCETTLKESERLKAENAKQRERWEKLREWVNINMSDKYEDVSRRYAGKSILSLMTELERGPTEGGK